MRLRFALLPLLLSIAAPASAQYMAAVWEQPDLGEYLGAHGLEVYDLDGDGDLEVLFTGLTAVSYESALSRLHVLERSGSGYAVTASSAPVAGTGGYGTSPIRSVAVRGEGAGVVVYALLSDGSVRTFAGATLALLDTLTLGGSDAPSGLAVEDVNGDGSDDFVVWSASGYGSSESWLRVYDGATLALLWETNQVGASAAVGDVDGDGQVEVVVGVGRVLAGATGAVEWTYNDGFGSLLTLANVDADDELEIVAYTSGGGYALRAFDAAVRSPLWEIRLDSDLSTLSATDASGTWEVVTGPGQWGSITSYDAATREVRWSIGNPEHSTTAVAVGDLDGDGTTEVVWGAGHRSTGPDILFVGDTEDAAIEYKTDDLDGPFFVRVADLDGDDVPDLVTASRSSRSGYSGGALSALRGRDHAVLWDGSDVMGFNSWESTFGLGVRASTAGEPAEVYVSRESSTIAVTETPPALTWRSNALQRQTTFTTADLDGDGVEEIVTGGASGRVTVLDGQTRAVIWESVTGPSAVGGVRVANLDDDAALEIAWFNERGRVRVYDGATFLLDWESAEIEDATALDVGDLDRDGSPEIVVGRADGRVTVLSAGTFTEVGALAAAEGGAVSAVLVGNVDATAAPELIVVASAVRVVSWPSGAVRWEGPALGQGAGAYDAIHLADLDADGFMDLVIGGPAGVVQFEAAERYPDTTPPFVVRATPAADAVQISTDLAAVFTLSEPVDPATLSNAVRATADGVEVAVDAALSTDATVLTVRPASGEWPGAARVEVVLRATLADPAGNGLDGDRDRVAEGSPADDVVRAFQTGTGIDTVGPTFVALSTERDTVWAGVPLRVEGVVTDTSSVSTSGVAEAEYFVGRAGAPGTGTALAAADGAFDEAQEPFVLALGTADLAGGPYVLSLRARDTRGTWGDVVTVPFVVQTSAGSDWPQLGQNAQHTGFNARDTLAFPLRMTWETAVVDGPALRSPVVAAGKVFVTSNLYSGSAAVHALDTETGAQAWSYVVGNINGLGAPAYAYGYVYVQTNNHSPGSFVWGFDAETGAVAWQTSYPAQWQYGDAPTVADGTVFLNAGYYGGMYAYDAFTGEEQWGINLPQSDGWTPAYADGVLYAGWEQGGLYAVEAATGATRYTMGQPNSWGGRTSVYDRGVVYTTNPLTAIDIETQSVRWSKAGTLTPAVASGRVFAVGDGRLRAYDAASGQQLWTFSGDVTLDRSPVVAGPHVFVSSSSGTYALAVEDGQEVWRFGQGGAPVVAGGRLYLVAGGTVYAFESGEGTSSEPTAAAAFVVEPVFPNPVTGRASVAYVLPESGPVVVEVFDAVGRRVATLADGPELAGRHQATWDTAGAAPGVYLVRVRAAGASAAQRVSVVR